MRTTSTLPLFATAAGFFLLLFAAGCRSPVFPENCGDVAAALQAACCEEQNKDATRVQCVGEWGYAEKSGCVFTCSVDISDNPDKYSSDSNNQTQASATSTSIPSSDDSADSGSVPIEIDIS